MKNRTLFVGGLSNRTDDDSLQAMFRPYGTVLETRLIKDPETDACRGFAYVTFQSDRAAIEARSALNGNSHEGQELRVALAT